MSNLQPPHPDQRQHEVVAVVDSPMFRSDAVAPHEGQIPATNDRPGTCELRRA